MSDTPEIELPSDQTLSDTAAGSIFFIGNATVLIRLGGFSILTDPTFVHMHEQVSIGYGLHAKRLTNPAMEISELPRLDFILLSHFHGDHFDQVAERELDHSLPIVTTAEAAKELAARGFVNTHPLETWTGVRFKKSKTRLQVTAMPGRHGPPLSQLVLPDVMGSLLEFAVPGMAPFRLYITGDTLVIEDLNDIPRRYPALDLALLHLGGTRVLGIMVTMDGRQGVEMLRIVRPKQAIPIHYNDYDVFKSPLEDFKNEIDAAGLAGSVRYLAHGDEYAFRLSPG